MHSEPGGANRKHLDITTPEREQRNSQVRGTNEGTFTSAAVHLTFSICKKQMRAHFTFFSL